eukprot:6710209-Prymnesium_polylepis.1
MPRTRSASRADSPTAPHAVCDPRPRRYIHGHVATPAHAPSARRRATMRHTLDRTRAYKPKKARRFWSAFEWCSSSRRRCLSCAHLCLWPPRFQ